MCNHIENRGEKTKTKKKTTSTTPIPEITNLLSITQPGKIGSHTGTVTIMYVEQKNRQLNKQSSHVLG